MDCGIQAKKRRNRIFTIRDGWGTMKRMIRYGVTEGVDLKTRACLAEIEVMRWLNEHLTACCHTASRVLFLLTVLTSVSRVFRLAVAIRLVPSSNTAGPSILTKVLTDCLTTVWSSEPQRTAACGSPYWKKKIMKRKWVDKIVYWHGILAK